MRSSETSRRGFAGATVCLGLAAVGCLGLVSGAGAEPAWIKAARDRPPAIMPSTRVVVLFTRTELRLKPNGVLEWHEQRVVRILTPDGIDDASYAFVMEPTSTLQQLEAWTLGPSGVRAHAGRAEALESTLAPDGEYGDVRNVLLRAPEARAGDDVAFECRHSAPMQLPSTGWLPQTGPFPVQRAELSVDAPPDWTIRLASSATAASRSRFDSGVAAPAASRHRELTLGPLPEIVMEPMSPPIRSRLPRYVVSFVGRTGSSPSDDWQSVAAWYGGLTAATCSRDQAPGELDARVAGGDARIMTAALLDEVQHSVRYAAIELGLRRWVPDAAATTWQRRYGDCKDKAALFVAALAKRGIDARLVIACMNDVNQIDTSAVDLTAFNHVIVAVALPDGPGLGTVTVRGRSGRSWVLCDPTSTLPLGYLPEVLAGTWGVIADPGEGLVRLPESPVGVMRDTTRLKLADDGSIEGEVVLHCETQAAAGMFARLFDSVRQEDVRARAQMLLGGIGFQVEVAAVQPPVFDPTRGVLDCRVRIRAADVLGRSGRLRTLRPPFLFARRRESLSDESRSLPLCLGARHEIEEHVELELPVGWQCEQILPVHWTGEEGEYRLSMESGTGTVRLDRLYRQRATTLPAESYQRFRAWMGATFRGDNGALVMRTP